MFDQMWAVCRVWWVLGMFRSANILFFPETNISNLQKHQCPRSESAPVLIKRYTGQISGKLTRGLRLKTAQFA